VRRADVDLPRTGGHLLHADLRRAAAVAAVLGVGVVAPLEAWRSRPVHWSVRVAAMVGILLAIVGLASGPSGVTPDAARMRMQRQI